MKIGQGLFNLTALQQTLTPQQIQYLKLLQMPLQQLEQKISEELQENPFLETSEPLDEPQDILDSELSSNENFEDINQPYLDDLSYEIETTQIEDYKDPFEIYRKIWEEDEISLRKLKADYSDDEEYEPFQFKDTSSFIQELLQQLRVLNLTEEEMIIGEQILGNINPDGYLLTDLNEIVNDANALIVEINLEREKEFLSQRRIQSNNPALEFAIPLKSKLLVEDKTLAENGQINFLKPVTIDDVERILKIVQQLDPPGVASRNLQECLVAQTKAISSNKSGRNVALRVLTEGFDLFSKKHFEQLTKKLNITNEELKQAVDFIKKLNPKPGIPDSATELNTVIPDFIIEKDLENNELIITLNESTIPALRINKTYELLKKDSKVRKENKEVRDWIRSKFEDAKFLIQALSQRRTTMLKVMTAIAYRQKEFFFKGRSALKPLIYKDIADDTGLDIATICRIVNNKFVQTDFGTFELKFFFSESLPTENGEEVSTKVIKQVIKEIIDSEPKDKPLSDEQIVEELKKRGYIVARRTVAKYREQMQIPVARLRKEL
ncbi:MAG: RNA polymerase factor sigma-54 [Candidatus Kapaibacteriales bacterium]